MLPALVCFDAGFTLMRPRETMEARLARILQGHGHDASAEDLRLAWEAADAWFWETYHHPGNDAWTNDAGPVTAAQVAAVRDKAPPQEQ